MNIFDIAVAKSYTSESLQGAGAIQGKPGKDGIDGKSAYEIAKDNGFIGTEQEWLTSLNGTNGKNGFSPVITENKDNTETNYRLDIITADGTFTTDNLKGARGEKGEQGKQGLRGEQGKQGVAGKQGIKGDKGDDGYPFLIYKEYNSLSEFNKADFPEIGLMFMVKEADPSSFSVYRYTGNEDSLYSYITSLSGNESIKGDKGDKGDKGEQGVDGNDGTTYIPQIGSVTKGETPSASVDIDEENATVSFNFVLPNGDKGDKGQDGKNGTDGVTPRIGKDNHWFIGEEDTGVLAEGKDGKSIQSIIKDDSNNIIVTFTDGTTQNIGQLNIDVQADFLTTDGFGNLRYYNGHFQYYNADSSTWIDTSVAPDNIFVVNMTPKPIKSISATYNRKIARFELRWQEPDDTYLDGQLFCIVEKVVLVRKKDSEPETIDDGTKILEVKRKHFNNYATTPYVDETLTPEIGDVWYYKIFPVSTFGVINTLSENAVQIIAKNVNLYGFKIDQNESDPASMITYIEDNKNFRPVHMDYETDTFDYGDWKDIFFMRVRPCMLKYDGTVDYYLTPNNYDLKEDGTPSDVADVNYGGNAMIQFPKVYWKIVDNGDNTANVYFSDEKLDDDFHCWSHIDNNGNEIPYCYMPIYNGHNDGTRLRNLSGKTPIYSRNATYEISLALANNQADDIIWYTELFCDRMLVDLLLLLIGKSTDTRYVFGNGHYTGGTTEKNLIKTGIMNDKGLFYGTNDTGKGVKVFGMEHYWGNQYRRIAGWINAYGTQKIKMTYGQSDGSTVDGYNTTGDGYITIPNYTSNIFNTSGVYISKMLFNEYGFIPKTADGSATTFYTDGIMANNGANAYPLVGGSSCSNLLAGAFCTFLYRNASITSWDFGASISCKPLAQTGGTS